MLAKKNGLGPALPHLQNPRLLPTIVADFDLPPSPAIPPQSHATPFASFERTYEVDPEALKPGVLEDLAAVVRTWHLEEGLDAELVTPTQQGAALGNSFLQPSEFNVLAALKNTTRAIRSVRNYVLALPDELPTSQVRQFRPGSLSKTPRAVKHAAKHGTGDAHVRKAALDVLTVLRDLEERARIPGTENADDSMTSSNSGGFLGEGERSLTPSSIGSDERRSSFGGAGTSGRSNSFSVPVWEDDEDEEEIDEAPKREGWDDRLVLGGGWLYRADIKIAELHKERAIIQRYLDTVDKIVFSDGSKLKSPPKTSLALTEEPEEEERFKEVQDRELPNWARRHPFGEDFDGTSASFFVIWLDNTLTGSLDQNVPELYWPHSCLSRCCLCCRSTAQGMTCLRLSPPVKSSAPPTMPQCGRARSRGVTSTPMLSTISRKRLQRPTRCIRSARWRTSDSSLRESLTDLVSASLANCMTS